MKRHRKARPLGTPGGPLAAQEGLVAEGEHSTHDPVGAAWRIGLPNTLSTAESRHSASEGGSAG